MAVRLNDIGYSGRSFKKFAKPGGQRSKPGVQQEEQPVYGAGGAAKNALYGAAQRGSGLRGEGTYGGAGTRDPEAADDNTGDESGAPTAGTENGGAQSFDDYYTRLIESLRSYGIELELPTLEELRDQLAAFLRPSVDEAIESRRRHGETAAAELDADAYSRGMGGSSYLSSMKNREQDAVERDIAGMERGYSATLAQYLYNASNELAGIQARFAQMRREQEYQLARQREQQRFELEMQRRRERHDREMQQLRSRNYGSGGSAAGDGDGGETLSEKQYRANYNAYSIYFQYLSAVDRYKVFHSGGDYWQSVRDDMSKCLTAEALSELTRRYDPAYSAEHWRNGGHGQYGPQYEYIFD